MDCAANLTQYLDEVKPWKLGNRLAVCARYGSPEKAGSDANHSCLSGLGGVSIGQI